MIQTLQKWTGKTKDFRGCEFLYICYAEIEMKLVDGEMEKVSHRKYISEAFGLSADTLPSLKEKITELKP